MESSMNNSFIMGKHETTAFSGDQAPEESSWTMYFEDFFETPSSIVDVGDYSSISDAASFVATKRKNLNVSKQEGSDYSNKFDIKRTRNREVPFGRRHHDLEDTASSPSRSPNLYNMNMMNLLYINTRQGAAAVADDTLTSEKGALSVRNQDEASLNLPKKGLCLVPLSIVTNFLG